MGSLNNNIAWVYHDSGRFEEALAAFQKALAFFETNGNPTTLRIAKWSVARCLRSLKRYDEALEIQEALEDEFDAAVEPDGYVYEELAELNIATGQSANAKEYFKKAYDVLSKDEWFRANEPARLQRLKIEAGVF
jgi:tetratricopeptide (TPR) repeat protein